MSDRATRLAPFALSLLRIMTALVVMQHGMHKLFGFPPDPLAQGSFGLLSIIGLAGIIEFGAGLLLLIGLFTRPAAFLLSGQMAAAYFLYHAVLVPIADGGFYPIMNGGDLAITLCFAFLYLSAAGPGPWSVDALRRRPSRTGTSSTHHSYGAAAPSSAS